jgi:hypothetical protein
VEGDKFFQTFIYKFKHERSPNSSDRGDRPQEEEAGVGNPAAGAVADAAVKENAEGGAFLQEVAVKGVSEST